jgi:hypothetical protein
MIAYKLFNVRKDGSIGSLFINRKARLPIGKWIGAESHETKGYKYRPYFHCLAYWNAPHLSHKNRQWWMVEIHDYQVMQRPERLGGIWLLANRMKIIQPIEFTSAEQKS